MRDQTEVRPQSATEGDTKNAGRAHLDDTGTVVVEGQILTGRDWDLYHRGRIDGRAEGYDVGWAAADEYATRAHRAAAEVVTAMIRVPEVDPAEAAARRARIDARFGGGGR